MLTARELTSSSALDLYRAIEQLRPQWLRPHAPTTTRREGGRTVLDRPTVQVYLDGFRYGVATDLKRIPASSVDEIRWLNASDATTRYGIGHSGGALLVMTQRDRSPEVER